MAAEKPRPNDGGRLHPLTTKEGRAITTEDRKPILVETGPPPRETQIRSAGLDREVVVSDALAAGIAIGTATVSAAGSARAEATVTADATVLFAIPAGLDSKILAVADGLLAIAPVLQQLLAGQSQLGGNARATIPMLDADAPRIAELTATTLNEEVRSATPRRNVIEQCLRVGKMILLAAMNIIATVVLAVDGNLVTERLRRMQRTSSE